MNTSFTVVNLTEIDNDLSGWVEQTRIEPVIYPSYFLYPMRVDKSSGDSPSGFFCGSNIPNISGKAMRDASGMSLRCH
jgi:hypothetical protein